MSIFMIMLAIGLFFPLITLVLSGFISGIGDIAHDFHADLGSLGDCADLGETAGDTGGSHTHFSFFPMSPLLWSAGLGVTGAVGEILRLSVAWPLLLLFAVAIPCGYAVMFVLLNFVFLPLKRADNSAKTEDDLAYSTAKVMEAIPAGGYGSVRIDGSVGTAMYAAYEVDGTAVPQGTMVWVIRIVNGRAEVQHDSSGKLAEIMN